MHLEQYIMYKSASATGQAQMQPAQQAAPPQPQSVPANQSVPASGYAPSVGKRYGDGSSDMSRVVDSSGKLLHSLQNHMNGDVMALQPYVQNVQQPQQQQAQSAGSLQKNADFWDETRKLGRGLRDELYREFDTFNNIAHKAVGVGRNIKNGVKAGYNVVKDLPEHEKNLSELSSNAEVINKAIGPYMQAYKDGGLPAVGKKVLNNVSDGLGDNVAGVVKPAWDFLKKDYTGLGLNNWKIGAGLLGAYGLYRMFSKSDEEKRHDAEMEELRKLRLQMQAQNLYNRY